MNGLLAALGFALTLGVAAPAVAEDWDCDNPDRDIKITNGSSYVITGVDIYNDKQLGEEQANRLGGSVIPLDEPTTFNADPTGEYHTYIVDVTTEEGYTASERIDACQFGAGWWIVDEDFEEEEGDY
jgi:hypothetical protein